LRVILFYYDSFIFIDKIFVLAIVVECRIPALFHCQNKAQTSVCVHEI